MENLDIAGLNNPNYGYRGDIILSGLLVQRWEPTKKQDDDGNST